MARQGTITSHENTISNKESEISRLQRLNDDQTAEITRYRSTIEQLQDEAKENQAQIQLLQRAKEERDTTITTCKSKIKTLEPKVSQYEKYQALTTYVLNKIIDINEVKLEITDDIKNEIDFEEYEEIIDEHLEFIEEWDDNSEILRNTQQQITSKTFDNEEENAEVDVIENKIYQQYISIIRIMQQQTKRLHQIGSNEHIVQLINTQNKISVKLCVEIASQLPTHQYLHHRNR